MPQKHKLKIGDIVMIKTAPKYLKGVNRISSGSVGEVMEIGHREVDVVLELENDDEPRTYKFLFTDLERIGHNDQATGNNNIIKLITDRPKCDRCGSLVEPGRSGNCLSCERAVIDNMITSQETNDVFHRLEKI